MERIDLHLHTTASDGTDTPRQVLERAAAAGLRAVAITDHDTTAGLGEAMEAGAELGIEVIPGIEISTDYRGTDAHILGYFIATASEALRPVINWSVSEREARNEHMLSRMRADGIDISAEMLRQAHPGAVLGRPHMAQRLIELGVAASVKDAFARFLGEGGKYYCERRRIPLAEAVRHIIEAGGVASIAHPLQYGFDREEVLLYLRTAKEAGCAALEAYYSEHSAEERQWLLDTAAEMGLAVSGGSDYHGTVKPHISVGTGINGTLAVPYEVLTRLRALRP